MLQRLADLLEQSLEELAQAESKDQGERGLCQPLPSFSCRLSSGAKSSALSWMETRLLRCWPFTPFFQVVSHMNRTQDSFIMWPLVGPSGPPTQRFSWQQ